MEIVCGEPRLNTEKNSELKRSHTQNACLLEPKLGPDYQKWCCFELAVPVRKTLRYTDLLNSPFDLLLIFLLDVT